jgi:hypothetical protein
MDNRGVAGRHRGPRRGPGRHRRQRQTSRWAGPALAAVVILGVGGVGAVNAILDHGTDRPPSGGPTTAVLGERATSPAAPSVTPTTAPATPSASPSAAPTHAAQPRRAALPWFAVTVTGRVAWVSVTRPDGHVLAQGLMRHGRSVRFPHRRPLAVVIGDAGAVRLVLRHHAHSPAGHRGQVLRFTVH